MKVFRHVFNVPKMHTRLDSLFCVRKYTRISHRVRNWSGLYIKGVDLKRIQIVTALQQKLHINAITMVSKLTFLKYSISID